MLAYSIIAPLVLGFAAICFFLFYLAYRYQFLYINGAKFDTKGLMYPRALQQLMVGLYVTFSRHKKQDKKLTEVKGTLRRFASSASSRSVSAALPSRPSVPSSL